ncbi:hypothetical protein [Propionivibrio sp.]|uniref:hypothetical protein n=1 Tax=Propionivibrio sp. TaxID=2212460 RepID=UPI00262DBF66|nr:hypothetical protein [Propionivibrio sp.]
MFDERNLFEFFAPDYPGERLVACRNAPLAKLRAHKRVGKVIYQYKVAKHFELIIDEAAFSFMAHARGLARTDVFRYRPNVQGRPRPECRLIAMNSV